MGTEYKIVEMDSDGRPLFALERSLYFPVQYLEPREGDPGLLGFDLTSDPLLRQDVRYAIGTGETIWSRAYQSGILNGTDHELLFLRVVYKKNAVVETEADKLNNQRGMIFAIYSMKDLVTESLRGLGPFGIHIAFYDILAEPGKQLLYFHESKNFPAPEEFSISPSAETVSGNHYWKIVDIGTKKWKVVCIPARNRWSLRSFWEPWAGALLGLITTLLTAFSMLLYQRRHEQFEKLVSERTRELQDSQNFLMAEVINRRDAEERLKLFIEHAPVAVAMFDTQMRYIITSRRWVEDLGLKGEPIIGRSHYEVFPESGDMPLLLETHQVCLQGACQKKEEELFIRRDGRKEWLRWEIHPWFKPDQTVGGLIMYVEQITVRKEAEIRLKEKEEMLQQSLKMEAIGRLAGGVAHDFNNQLTVIKGFASFLERSLTSSDERMLFVEEILIASERAARLTSQLLAFSRKQILNPIVLQPNEILSEMTEMIRRLIGEDVNYHFRGDPQAGLIQIDRGQFEQIMTNLIVNARDAMPDGGSLTVDTSGEMIGLSSAQSVPQLKPGEYVIISVTDSGSGIPSDVLPHIFEPFFTTKEKGKGTGLGLATCFGIIKQQGGHIEVRTEPGAGTSFKVYLPRVAKEVPSCEADRRLQLEDLPPGRETILLCEDESALRAVLKDTLTGHGYKVIEAADGEMGWRLIAKTRGDNIGLIVSDVIMPKMSGRELMKKVLESYPDIPILLISGYTDNSIKSHDIENGKAGFLHKPFSPDDLLLKIYEILQLKEKNRRKNLAS